MKKFLRVFILLRGFGAKMKEDVINAYSAQAAFFIFLSFFPFIMLLLTLLNYLPFDFRTITEADIPMLSDGVSSLLNSVISEIYEKSTGAVISVTTITALWSSSKGFLAIVRGLNSVYHTDEKRGYFALRLTSVLYTLVMVVVLVVTLLLLVFGGRINTFLRDFGLDLENVVGISVHFRWMIGVLLLLLFFMFVYTVVPERKTRFISELPGAAFSAVGWVGFSAIYSHYANNYANYSYVYGSITSIVVLMLWLYICVYILFIGAEINCFLKDEKISEVIKTWKEKRGSE